MNALSRRQHRLVYEILRAVTEVSKKRQSLRSKWSAYKCIQIHEQINWKMCTDLFATSGKESKTVKNGTKAEYY